MLLVISHRWVRSRKEGKYWCYPFPFCGRLADMMVFGETLTRWSFSSPWAGCRHLGSNCVLWPSLRSDVLRLCVKIMIDVLSSLVTCVNGSLNQGQLIKKKHFLTHTVLGNLTFCPFLILQGASFKHFFVHTEVLVKVYLSTKCCCNWSNFQDSGKGQDGRIMKCMEPQASERHSPSGETKRQIPKKFPPTMQLSIS